MTKEMKDQIAKAVYRVVERAVARPSRPDPIDLTERVMDAVELVYDMQTEESGIASIPNDLCRHEIGAVGTAWDHKLNAPGEDPTANEQSHFITPPPPRSAISPIDQKEKSVILMPSDPGFSMSSPPAPAEETARPGVFKASIRKAVSRRASNSPQKQYWQEADIISTIIAHTPEEIAFNISRADGSPFRVVAKRNVMNKQGLGSVVLTYKDDRVSDGGEIPLYAQVPFSLYDEHIDIDSGMKNIASQLVGIYRDRSAGNPEPTAYGPPPNLGDYMRTGMPAGNVDVRIDRGDDGRALNVGGSLYADRSQDSVLQSIMSTIKKGNTAMVPAESQLKLR